MRSSRRERGQPRTPARGSAGSRANGYAAARGALVLAPLSLFVLSVSTASSGCGARSGLVVADAGPDVEPALVDGGRVACRKDEDCLGDLGLCKPATCEDGACIAGTPVACDDADPCTRDDCVPDTGACTHTALAKDLDGDGFKGPAPGQKASDPDACGHDCDDTSAKAFPGNPEVCDGVDNDCNGVVDDDAKFVPVLGEAPVLVSDPSFVLGSAGGIAFGGKAEGYVAAYTGEVPEGTKIFVRALSANGVPLGTATAVNETKGDASGGPVVWTGDRYGLAWTDRRTGDYEIFFNTLGPDGKKLGPDVRLSFADDFSIGPSIGWNGSDFHVVWEDRRSGKFAIYGRQVALDGNLATPEIVIAKEDDCESPSIAASAPGMGVLYRTGDSQDSAIVFRSLSAAFADVGPPIVLAKDGNFETPQLVRNGDDFVAVWTKKSPHRVFGAVLGPKGEIKVAPAELSPPGGQNRAPYALPLGDRLVLVYSRQSDTGYDLWSRALSSTLVAEGEPALLTSGPGDDIAQSLTFGPSGDIGVFFDGKIPSPKGGLATAAFFTRLSCAAGASPSKP